MASLSWLVGIEGSCGLRSRAGEKPHVSFKGFAVPCVLTKETAEAGPLLLIQK